jgi:hypothetical protein
MGSSGEVLALLGVSGLLAGEIALEVTEQDFLG